MEPLKPQEQVHFATGLVKRFHPQATELAAERLTVKEGKLVQRYIDSILTPTAEEKEIDRQVQAGTLSLRLNKKRLAALIKEELDSVLGSPSEIWSSREWWYVTTIGEWNVRTNISLAGRYHYQLGYHHRISVVGGPHEIMPWTSMLSWLGISSQTTWDLLSDSDIPEAAKTVALLCSHFLEAVPDLLDEPNQVSAA